MDYLNDLQAYRDREIAALGNLDLEAVNDVMNVLEDARLAGRRIFICGNGGSSATASHYCCDFNKGVSEKLDKKYDIVCLSDNVPTMMAIANDIGYGEIFRFQLRGKIAPGDILIGISGSGNSENVVNAFEYARRQGGIVIAFVGYSGGRMKELADHSIHINLDDMQIAEDLHMILDHMMMYVLNHRG